ncbi:hypothetical protein [Pandoraea oxalativorans]|uniref:hypothetical protein n=1 Tax=Pandoraea oxalativorans TaxID=573737 RepID=UPI001B804491|nr:hypothetical protein [Pandoraea oxalativorans]
MATSLDGVSPMGNPLQIRMPRHSGCTLPARLRVLRNSFPQFFSLKVHPAASDLRIRHNTSAQPLIAWQVPNAIDCRDDLLRDDFRLRSGVGAAKAYEKRLHG